jgi:hypothetical protein
MPKVIYHISAVASCLAMQGGAYQNEDKTYTVYGHWRGPWQKMTVKSAKEFKKWAHEYIALLKNLGEWDNTVIARKQFVGDEFYNRSMKWLEKK